MRRQQQQLDPDMLQMQQQVDLMKSMGMMQDPLKQASGLVQLMNASQAPGIQQSQFDRQMGLKELVSGQEMEYRNKALAQQGEHQQWQQGAGDRTFGLQEKAFGLDEKKLQQAKDMQNQQLLFQRWLHGMGLLGEFAQQANKAQYGGPGLNFQSGEHLGQSLGFPGLFGSTDGPQEYKLNLLPFTNLQMDEFAKQQ